MNSLITNYLYATIQPFSLYWVIICSLPYHVCLAPQALGRHLEYAWILHFHCAKVKNNY